MNYLFFVLKTAFFDFSRNKLRTFLTSLGILIGVAAVVMILAFGLGLKAYIKQQFESLGTNLIYVMPGNLSEGRAGMGGMIAGIRFDAKDVKTVKRVKKVARAVPVFATIVKVQGEKKSANVEVAATTYEIFSVMNLEMEYGQAFKKSDDDKGNKKAVLGPNIAEKLFGSAGNALGKNIKIEKQNYKVVGVAKSKGGGGLGAPSIDDHVYIPYKSAYSFNPDKRFMAIYVEADNDQNISQLKKDIKNALAKRYDEDKFSVTDQAEILNIFNSIFGVLNMVLVGIGAISLLVGGIGIMNIMYVSVTERIKEIGIRRAVGATKKDILYQFLGESVLLSIFGGLSGLLVALIVVLVIRNYFPAYIDIPSVLIAILVSSVIGIAFGVFPAKKAADLSPIDAIRYE